MTEDAPGAKRLLILGTGAIARTHAEKFALIPGCELVAAADMNAERARDFAAAHTIPNAFGSLADAIAWGEFDAAVNSTPDPVLVTDAGNRLILANPAAAQVFDVRIGKDDHPFIEKTIQVKALNELVRENYGEMTLNINPDSIYTGALGGATFAWRAVVEEGKVAEARA